jgi:hypothetical protein
MACAKVAQASDLRRPVVPSLDRHHAGVAENQSREIASSASDNSRRLTPAQAKHPQTGALAKGPPPSSSRQGIVTEGEDPSGAS